MWFELNARANYVHMQNLIAFSKLETLWKNFNTAIESLDNNFMSAHKEFLITKAAINKSLSMLKNSYNAIQKRVFLNYCI